MNKLIVGCPSRNDLKTLQLMVNSLLRSTSAFDKLIIVDNSTDGTKEYLDYLKMLEPKVEVIYENTKTPLDAYNLLFKIAKRENADLLLTQTDVIFPTLYNRDWLQEMKEIAKNETVGAVTTLNGCGISGPDYVDGFRWLGGHCTYIPIRTIQKLGGYDENFPEGQYGVDIDYTYRIVKLGLQIVYINYWCDHHMANSREHDNHPETENHKKECAKFFKTKWGLT